MTTAGSGLGLASGNGLTYRFDPGALCLELLTTGGPLTPYETLHSPADLARWAALSRLGLDAGRVSVDAAELAQAKRLRAALWRLAGDRAALNHAAGRAALNHAADRAALSHATGRAAPNHAAGRTAPDRARPDPARPADRATLNRTAAAAPLVPRMAANTRHAWALPASGTQLLSTVARDAIELFTGPLADRIRQCAADDCRWIFVDTSRPGARRWCSMDVCGNRHNVRALRSRRGRDT